jgi:branched-chain amino acid aminotransferase
MEEAIYYNGSIIKANQLLFGVDNRGLKYGDGFFETIRIIDGKPCFLNLHLKRLTKAANFLHLIVNQQIEEGYLNHQIHKLLAANHHPNDARLRISIIRKAGGLYMPLTNETDVLMELKPLNYSGFFLPEMGLNIGICDIVSRQQHKISNIKTSSCIVPVLASIWYSQNNFDECLVLNDSGRIAEASAANVFFVNTDGSISTPNLGEGCIAGIMREMIIDISQNLGIQVNEQPVCLSDLSQASEMFLTNAINGIRWVASCNGKTYGNPLSKKLMLALRNHIGK